MQRNTNIKRLELWDLSDVCLASILQRLQSNDFLKTLVIGVAGNFSNATTLAIQHFLESTASVQTFGLGGVRLNNNSDMFRAIAQSLIQSPVVCGLEFWYCHFCDEESTALFRSILQNKQTLASLCLEHCSYSGGQVNETIVSILSQLDSPLRIFELKVPSLDRSLPNGQFRNLLRAVEKSKLDRFVIGTIEFPQQLRTLTESIPLMRVKDLKVIIASYFDEGNAKPLLLRAIKNNFSLRSVKFVKAQLPEIDLFDANDKLRLAFYANRNKRLDQWADNPETVSDRKVWPEALKLAEQAGPDSLFRGLRSVLADDSAGLRVGRKRKRPQYYAPS